MYLYLANVRVNRKQKVLRKATIKSRLRLKKNANTLYILHIVDENVLFVWQAFLGEIVFCKCVNFF